MQKYSPNARKYMTRNPIKAYLLNRFFAKLKLVISDLRPNVILEVGCGEGYIAALVKSIWPRVTYTGIDISESAVALARERCPDLTFNVADIRQISYEPKAFDLVICAEVLEHLEAPASALETIALIGKRALLSVPHEPWFRLLNFMALNHFRQLGNAPGHINHWGVDDFRTLVATRLTPLVCTTALPWIIILATPES